MNDIAEIGTDPQALERFYRATIEDVQRFVARRVDDPQRAADLTADVYLTAIEAAHTYRSERGSGRAWLFGIAHNVLRNDARSRRRHHDAVDRYRWRGELAPDAMERAVERLDAAAAARRYLAALEQLPPRMRAVLELVVIDELSITEAATALGISPGTARVRLHRARRRLRTDPPHPASSPTTEGV